MSVDAITTVSPRERAAVRAIRAGLLVTLVLAACARSATPTRADASAADTAVVPPPARAADQRPYVVERLPKAQAVRVNAHTVRGPLGIPLEVISEDADTYEVKRYSVASAPNVPSPHADVAGADASAGMRAHPAA